MGMAKSNGTLRGPKNKKNCFVVPPSEVEEVVPKSVDTKAPSPSEVLNNEDYIVKSTDNGINQKADDVNMTALITAYISGSTITVTWFHQLNSDQYGRSFRNDFSRTLESVHYSYMKINNFQFKLKDNFSFSYSTDTVTSQLTGEGVLYPYFCPQQGDMFIYEVESGIYGLYELTEAPTRLTIKNNTCHAIKFRLKRYLNADDYKKLQECVDQEVYFDLTRYLNSEGSFISADESTTLGDIKEKLNTLIHYYVEEFFESDIYRTFIENPCIYDPYVLEFVVRLIDYKYLPHYPVQLVSDPLNWKRSIWFRLLSPDTVPDSVVIDKCFRVLKQINYRTVGVNALANRCYIQINKDGKHPYPPFRIPEEYDENEKTVQMQLTLYLNEGKVRPTILLSLVDKVLSANRTAQFYFIPILIFLLKKLQESLETGNSIILGDLNDKATCTNDCANCVLVCDKRQSGMCHPKPVPPVSHIPSGCARTKCSCVTCKYLIPDDGGHVDDPSLCDDIREDIIEPI